MKLDLSEVKEFISDSFTTSSAIIIESFAGIFFLFCLYRGLEIYDVGVFNLIISMILFAEGFALNFEGVLNTKIAQLKEKNDESGVSFLINFSYIVYIGSIVLISMILIFSSAALLSIYEIDESRILIILFSSVILLRALGGPVNDGLLKAFGRYDLHFFNRLLVAIPKVFAGVAIYLIKPSLLTLAMILLITEIPSVIFRHYLKFKFKIHLNLRNILSEVKKKTVLLKSYMRFFLPVYINYSFSIAAIHLSTILIGYLISIKMAAVFYLANSVYLRVMGVLHSLPSVSTQYLAKANIKGDILRTFTYQNHLTQWITFPICIILMLVALPFFKILNSEIGQESYILFILMLLQIPALQIASTSRVGLYAINESLITLYVNLIKIIIQFSIYYYFFKYFAEKTFPIGMLIAGFSAFILTFEYFARRVNISLKEKFISYFEVFFSIFILSIIAIYIISIL